MRNYCIANRNVKVLTILVVLLGIPVATAAQHVDFEMVWVAACYDSAGTPLSSGNVQIRIYDAATEGELVYNSGSDFNAAIHDGVAQLCLGCVTDLAVDLVNRYYLEIDIDGEEVIGDAAGGRLEFYPGAGDHSRPLLENRLHQLESLLGISGGTEGADDSRGTQYAFLDQAGEQLRFGLLGQGVAIGASDNYTTNGNLLWQPTGEFHSVHYGLFLGPYYLLLMESGGEGCCGIYTDGITGNTNCSVDGKLTLSDITQLIDNVYISKNPLCCHASGNTNGSTDCKITLSDITKLIDAVYISKADPEACMPQCEI